MNDIFVAKTVEGYCVLLDLEDVIILRIYNVKLDNIRIHKTNSHSAPFIWYPEWRKRGKIPLAGIIMQLLPNQELVVDHINRNPFDNRRSNLRIITKLQNCYNKSPRYSYRYKGIHKRGNKWKAHMVYRRKNVYIGYFNTAEEAARAYDTKAKELFGEFAYLNFPDEVKI